MKRILSILLALLTVASICVFTVGVSATESGDLYASVISFDNTEKYGSYKLSTDATVKTVKETSPAENPDDNDVVEYHLEISGDGIYSVNIDASHLDFSAHKVLCAVIDSTSDQSKLSVTPVFTAGGQGSAAQLVQYNGIGYFKFSEAADISGIVITTLEEDFSFDMTEVFLCENEYSAKYVVDNNVLPSTAERKQLIVNDIYEATPINCGKAKDEGAIDCDLYNTKWPNITVDENDKIYLVGTGCRGKGHNEIIDSAVICTSEDGGITYTTPKRLFNCMHGDSPSIYYYGNGKLIASIGKDDAAAVIPGGSNEGLFKLKRFGGEIEDESLADSWPNGYAEGGLLGTYVDILEYLVNDPDYYTDAATFMIKSDDYGETWNVVPYTFEGVEGVDYTTEMRELAERYELCDWLDYPYSGVGYGGHGPRALSDGTFLYIGKETYSEKNCPEGAVVVDISKDEGDTWEFFSEIKLPCTYGYGDFHEPDFVENKDGVLICGFRSFVVFNAYSYDGGYTWTTPIQTEMQGYPPSYVLMPNGDIVCTTNWRYGEPKIFVYVSEDGGRTWSSQARLARKFTSSGGFSTDMGYPNSVVLSDGTIVTCYYIGSDIGTTNWTYELIDREPNSWAHCSKGWFYYDADMNVVKGSWINDGVGECYLDTDGYLVTSRSIKNGKKYYLVGDNGYKITKPGWQKVSGSWYYVQSDGSLKTGGWMKDSKGWCYLASNGTMVTSRAIKDTKGYCLVDANGYWVTRTGWQKAGSDWYYVLKGGYLKTSTWMKDSKGWCYLGADGKMYKNQTVKDTKGYCLVDGSGYWVTKSGWKKAGDDWYYVQKNSYVLTNSWMNDSRGWCYLDSNGTMLKSIAVKDKKGWCYLNSEGYWQKSAEGEIYVNGFYGGGADRGLYTINKNGYLNMN